MFKETNNKLRGITNLKEVVSNEESLDPMDKTKEFLDKFQKDAESLVRKVDERIKKIEDTYKDLAIYFVENPKDFTIEIFFEHFNKFCAQVIVISFLFKT